LIGGHELAGDDAEDSEVAGQDPASDFGRRGDHQRLPLEVHRPVHSAFDDQVFPGRDFASDDDRLADETPRRPLSPKGLSFLALRP
jgi:hypothetical protein